MELKSPTNATVQVALLSGHCIVVGPEGREVPKMFLSEAFKCGCIPIDVNADDIEVVEQKDTSKSNQEIIVAAIKEMLEGDYKLTGAGLPNLKELSAITGFRVSAVELSEAWQTIEAELK